MKASKPPEPLPLEEAEAKHLIERAERGALSAAEQKRVARLIRVYVWLQSSLLETRIGLARLKRLLFGPRTEKGNKGSKDPSGGSSQGDLSRKSSNELVPMAWSLKSAAYRFPMEDSSRPIPT